MHLFRSCSALTLEDEKRSLALLIIGFIRMVSLVIPQILMCKPIEIHWTCHAFA